MPDRQYISGVLKIYGLVVLAEHVRPHRKRRFACLRPDLPAYGLPAYGLPASGPV